MVDTHSSPTHEKPNLDALFPELRKQQQHRSDTQMGGPRFMAPATTAAALLGKGAREPARVVPPPPSVRTKSLAAPPSPPSRRVAAPPVPRVAAPVEIEAEEALPTSPDASSAPIQPVDDDDAYVDEGPTILKPSPFFGSPFSARPPVVQAEQDVPRAPMPPPSVQSAPLSATRLPPPPSFAKSSAPSAGKLPPVPTPPSSLRNATPSSYPSLPKATPVLDDEAETLAPPTVSSSSSRNATAASLVAPAAVPSQRYVPPSVPPPAPRPRSALETMPANRFPSLAPTAASVPPPALSAAPKKQSRLGLFALAAVGTIGLAAAAGFFVTQGGVKALGLGNAGTGALAISAAGPNNIAVNGVRVFVDGAVKCEGSPCRIADISTGTHFISVDAPGFGQTAARAVSVTHGNEAALHIDLVPQQAAAPAQPAPVKAVPTTAEPEDFKVMDTKAPAEPAAKVATAPKSEAKSTLVGKKSEAKKAVEKEAPAAAPAGDATLNINSIPVASVVLDGRPMGSTPLVGVHVAPGAHSVVFIHPEKGRKAAGASVKAGGSATVAVRF